jgi:hypothetical protein
MACSDGGDSGVTHEVSGVANLYERGERMGKLEPMFVDITWGAGGSTTDLTLELRCDRCHSRFISQECEHWTTCNLWDIYVSVEKSERVHAWNLPVLMFCFRMSHHVELHGQQ